ncbi:vacuolar membrane-associated protein iml1 [Mycoemilia scoparia]|uniref:Vacuolar membrane-associated protein IML1 n=1 Tax=Mycoemilia scoparia TaxID=417184 RepID=A0A9W8A556_9FUNG|nr:vacuolar membrane-associated protein iml1 [Mycoemilia scoparia]
MERRRKIKSSVFARKSTSRPNSILNNDGSIAGDLQPQHHQQQLSISTSNIVESLNYKAPSIISSGIPESVSNKNDVSIHTLKDSNSTKDSNIDNDNIDSAITKKNSEVEHLKQQQQQPGEQNAAISTTAMTTNTTASTSAIGTGAQLEVKEDLTDKICMIKFHDQTYNPNEVILNPQFFPNIKKGDIVSVQLIIQKKKDDDEGAEGGSGIDGNSGLKDNSNNNNGSGYNSGDRFKDIGLGKNKDHRRQQGGGGDRGDSNNSPPFSGIGGGGANKGDKSKKGGNKGVGRSRSKKGGNKGSNKDSKRKKGQRVEERDDERYMEPDTDRELLATVGELRSDIGLLQASILNLVSESLWGGTPSNAKALIKKVDIKDPQNYNKYHADHVEICFRDQYVGRSDMWRLWLTVVDQPIYYNAQIELNGILRASIKRVFRDGQEAPCGYIDKMTKPVFRSESGKFIIFIQMSSEMWLFEDDGEIYFEKAITHFLNELFTRWSRLRLNHSVSIVLFSRFVHYFRDSAYCEGMVYDKERRWWYRDYYKVIADMEVRSNWTVVLPFIAAEFDKFKQNIMEMIVEGKGRRIFGEIVKSHLGNVLEAINMGINSYSDHYINRDLSRTGLSMIVITPGCGMFDVSKNLLRMTAERMNSCGLRLDLVCLARKPLFRPPVFQYWSRQVPTEAQANQASIRLVNIEQQQQHRLIHHDEQSYGGHHHSFVFNHIKKPYTTNSTVYSSIQDPLLFDPLYFNEEEWLRVFGEYFNEPPEEPLSDTDSDDDQADLSTAEAKIELTPEEILNDVGERWWGFARGGKNKKAYYYFPHWIDCGFYECEGCVGGDKKSEGPQQFLPRIKMPFLSDPIVAQSLKTLPTMPDLDESILRLLSRNPTPAVTPEDTIKSAEEKSTPGDGDDHNSSRSGKGGNRRKGMDARESIKAFFDACDEYDQSLFQKPKLAPSKDGKYAISTILGYEKRRLQTVEESDGESRGGAGYQERPHSGGAVPTSIRPSSGTSGKDLRSHNGSPGKALEGNTDDGKGTISASLPDYGDGLSLVSNPKAIGALARQQQDHLQRQSKKWPISSSPGYVHESRMYTENYSTQHVNSIISPTNKSVDSYGNQIPSMSSTKSKDYGNGKAIISSYSPDKHPMAISRLGSQPRPILRAVPASSSAQGGRSLARNGQQPSNPIYRSSSTTSSHRGSPQQHMARPPNSHINPQSDSAFETGTDGSPRQPSGMGIQPQGRTQIQAQKQLSPIASSRNHALGTVGQSGRLSTIQSTRTPTRAPPTSSTGFTTVKGSGGSSGGLHQRRQKGHLLHISNMPTQQFIGVTRGAPEHNNPAPLVGITNPSPRVHRHSWIEGEHNQSSIYGQSDKQLTLYATKATPHLLYNPCNPNIESLPRNSQSQRWIHAIFNEAALSSYSTKWVSLCTPGSLPLTTDFIPLGSLEILFKKYSYTVGGEEITTSALNSATGRTDVRRGSVHELQKNQPAGAFAPTSRSDPRYLLRELIYQRLSQGFQFILLNSKDKIRLSRLLPSGQGKFTTRSYRAGGASVVTPTAPGGSGARGREAMVLSTDTNPASASPNSTQTVHATSAGTTHSDGHSTRGTAAAAAPAAVADPDDDSAIPDNPTHVYMTNGFEIHHLSCENSLQSGKVPTVSIDRYERNISYNALPIDYKYMVWPRNGEKGYMPSNIRFPYPQDTEINWNNVDQLVLGAQSEVTEAHKCWRTRYVLIPSESLSADASINSKTHPMLNEEELRIANFEKFLDHVFKSLRHDERQRLEKLIPGHNSLEKYMNRRRQQLQQHQRTIRSGTQKPQERKPPAEQLQNAVSNSGNANDGTLTAEPTPITSAAAANQSPLKRQEKSKLRPMSEAKATRVHLETLSRKSFQTKDMLPSELLRLKYTTLLPSAYTEFQYELFRQKKRCALDDMVKEFVPIDAVIQIEEKLTEESSFHLLYSLLRHPKCGVPLTDIRWHCYLYKDSFFGHQFIRWVMVNFDTIRTRQNAIKLGQKFLERGLIHHVGRGLPFMDGQYVYRLTPDANAFRIRLPGDEPDNLIPGQLRKSFANIMPTFGPNGEIPASLNIPKITPVSPSKALSSQQQQRQQQAHIDSILKKPLSKSPKNIDPNVLVLQASCTLALDLDPTKRSDRNETVWLYLDLVHNPWSCFHLSINWLNCTSKLIDQLIQSWSRTAERCGMKLVDAPLATTLQNTHPFHSPIEIAICCPPPDISVLCDFCPFGSGDKADKDKAKVSTLISSTSYPLSPSAAMAENRDGLSSMSKAVEERESKSVGPSTANVNPKRSSSSWSPVVVSSNVSGLSRVLNSSGICKSSTSGAAEPVDKHKEPATSAPPVIGGSSGSDGDGGKASELLAEGPYDKAKDATKTREIGEIEFAKSSDPNRNSDGSYGSDTGDNQKDGAEKHEDNKPQSRKISFAEQFAASLPKFVFEREFLFDQGFILDVEAEDSYLPNTKVKRVYPYNRVVTNYPQFIHRSGMAFVQIRGPGLFYWFNNNLYSSRVNHIRNPQQSGGGGGGPMTISNQPSASTIMATTPGPHTSHSFGGGAFGNNSSSKVDMATSYSTNTTTHGGGSGSSGGHGNSSRYTHAQQHHQLQRHLQQQQEEEEYKRVMQQEQMMEQIRQEYHPLNPTSSLWPHQYSHREKTPDQLDKEDSTNQVYVRNKQEKWPYIPSGKSSRQHSRNVSETMNMMETISNASGVKLSSDQVTTGSNADTPTISTREVVNVGGGIGSSNVSAPNSFRGTTAAPTSGEGPTNGTGNNFLTPPPTTMNSYTGVAVGGDSNSPGNNNTINSIGTHSTTSSIAANNANANSSSQTTAAIPTSPEVLRIQFQKACRNVKKVEVFWAKTVERIQMELSNQHSMQQEVESSLNRGPLLVDQMGGSMWSNFCIPK